MTSESWSSWVKPKCTHVRKDGVACSRTARYGDLCGYHAQPHVRSEREQRRDAADELAELAESQLSTASDLNRYLAAIDAARIRKVISQELATELRTSVRARIALLRLGPTDAPPGPVERLSDEELARVVHRLQAHVDVPVVAE